MSRTELLGNWGEGSGRQVTGVSGEGRGKQRLNNGSESWDMGRERFPSPANS